jgi:folate-binding protein YgfZ
MQPARRVFTSASAASAASRPGIFTFRGCLQRRAFSHSAPRASAPAPAPAGPSPAGLAQLSSRGLISLSGPDAAKYLQGVITANLFPGSPVPAAQHLRSDAGFYAAFLTAQGRVLHDVFVYHDARDTSSPPGTSWLLEVDSAEADRLLKHMRRYKLRAKFNTRLLDPGEAHVWQAWDDTSPFTLPATPNVITTPDTRAPNLGHRILTFSPAPPETPQQHPQVPESAYTLRRYLHGIAEGQAEILHAQALPHESNLDQTGAVDFRKGCYVGQELTIRTEHRGVVRKRVLPCVLYPEEEVSPGLEGGLAGAYRPLVAEGVGAEMVPAEASIGRVGRKGRSAGKWLRGVGNVGLAVCRLEIMTDVVLPGEVAAGGFVEGDEFVVGLGGEDKEDGRKVKIKAFVPEWLRAGLAGKAAQGH